MICPLCREDVEDKDLPLPYLCPSCRGNATIAAVRALDRLTAAIDRLVASTDRNTQLHEGLLDVSRKQLAALNRDHH